MWPLYLSIFIWPSSVPVWPWLLVSYWWRSVVRVSPLHWGTCKRKKMESKFLYQQNKLCWLFLKCFLTTFLISALQHKSRVVSVGSNSSCVCIKFLSVTSSVVYLSDADDESWLRLIITHSHPLLLHHWSPPCQGSTDKHRGLSNYYAIISWTPLDSLDY